MSSSTNSRKVLLFDEDDEPGQSQVQDPAVLAGIDRYLKERNSASRGHAGAAPAVTVADVLAAVAPKAKAAPKKNPAAAGADGEEHTGITDDEADAEEDYQTASRGTLKASSEALVEVMEEVKRLMSNGEAPPAKAAAARAAGAGAPGAGAKKPAAGPSKH